MGRVQRVCHLGSRGKGLLLQIGGVAWIRHRFLVWRSSWFQSSSNRGEVSCASKSIVFAGGIAQTYKGSDRTKVASTASTRIFAAEALGCRSFCCSSQAELRGFGAISFCGELPGLEQLQRGEVQGFRVVPSAEKFLVRRMLLGVEVFQMLSLGRFTQIQQGFKATKGTSSRISSVVSSV